VWTLRLDPLEASLCPYHPSLTSTFPYMLAETHFVRKRQQHTLTDNTSRLGRPTEGKRAWLLQSRFQGAEAKRHRSCRSFDEQ